MIGCSTSPAPVDTEDIVEDVPTTITIKHELDEITVDKNPEKVIVFDYGILDALDNIGEDIIGLPKKSVPSTKAYKNDNIIYLDSYIWYVSSGGLTGTIKMVDEIQSSLEK